NRYNIEVNNQQIFQYSFFLHKYNPCVSPIATWAIARWDLGAYTVKVVRGTLLQKYVTFTHFYGLLFMLYSIMFLCLLDKPHFQQATYIFLALLFQLLQICYVIGSIIFEFGAESKNALTFTYKAHSDILMNHYYSLGSQDSAVVATGSISHAMFSHSYLGVWTTKVFFLPHLFNMPKGKYSEKIVFCCYLISLEVKSLIQNLLHVVRAVPIFNLCLVGISAGDVA
ncbi:hypothetical protein ACJX0J_033346, partial [Zea mays]